MEYTQWAHPATLSSSSFARLNPCCNGIYSMSVNWSKLSRNNDVLILVVMEYTQWEKSMNEWKTKTGLNPCCNGIYSMRSHQRFWCRFWGLNPCCNGIYSMRSKDTKEWRKTQNVLILVVMEYTQWVATIVTSVLSIGLNPCCNGIYSMRIPTNNIIDLWKVLILVVMEYTQWVV